MTQTTRSPIRRKLFHSLIVLLGPIILLSPLCGCARVPSIDVEGSFLPSWMLCLFFGSLASVAVYSFVLRRKLQKTVSPSVIFYPSLTVTVACTCWLLFFR